MDLINLKHQIANYKWFDRRTKPYIPVSVIEYCNLGFVCFLVLVIWDLYDFFKDGELFI